MFPLLRTSAVLIATVLAASAGDVPAFPVSIVVDASKPLVTLSVCSL